MHLRAQFSLLGPDTAEKAPNQFAALAGFFSDRANTAAFLYDDSARLVEGADLLRREALRFSGQLLIVAHSMGALLVARAGSGDCDGPLRYISVVGLNPLIGGSHYADDIPALRWLPRSGPSYRTCSFLRASRT